MTFDSQISTTFETAVQDAIDKISGMTGWSVIADNWDPSGSNTWYAAISTPYAGHDLVIASASNGLQPGSASGYDLALTYGEDWDDANTTFTGQEWCDGGAHVYDGSNQVAAADNVEYWLEYVPSQGFVFYVRRVEADGNDSTGCVAWEEYDTYWDHESINRSETQPKGLVGMVGGDNQDDGSTGDYTVAEYGRSSEDGNGVINPDPNFTNYVWDKHKHRLDLVTDPDTNFNPRFADTYLGIREQSGTDLNSGDTVQDSGGSNLYRILKYNGANIAMRMD